MSEENKEVIHRFNEAVLELFRSGNSDSLDNILAPNVVMHMPGMPPVASSEEFKQLLSTFMAGLGDMEGGAENLVAEGDRVAYQLTWSATHTGPIMGVAPTGKRITMTEMHIARIERGNIVERWSELNMLVMMQQLGVIPSH